MAGFFFLSCPHTSNIMLQPEPNTILGIIIVPGKVPYFALLLQNWAFQEMLHSLWLRIAYTSRISRVEVVPLLKSDPASPSHGWLKPRELPKSSVQSVTLTPVFRYIWENGRNCSSMAPATGYC